MERRTGLRTDQQTKGWYDSAQRGKAALEEFLALYRYRELIRQLIARSVKTRYKRSALGVAWTMVNPLLTMGVLTLVFSGLFKFSAKNYSLYILSGLLLWNFFAQSTTAAMGDLIWSGGLIGRVYFPKSVFPVSAVGTGLLNFTLALVPYFIIAILLGAKISLSVLYLPIPMLIATCFTLGVAMALSSLVVFFADVLPMYEILLTAWLYLTPVIYPMELLPQSIQGILRFNPLLPILECFRAPLYEARPPDFSILISALAIALAVLMIGWWLFTRRSREYATYV
jgi:ABC-type polysaccharide/polyol phosphate export permease